MRHAMGTLCLWLDRALFAAVGAALIGIFLLNMYQVGGRYLFGVGAVWIPDVSRFLFIWMTFLGTALVSHRKQHLAIDFVVLRLPLRLRRVSDAVIRAGMLGLAGVLAVVGWRIMQIRMDIPYTGWEVPTGYAYLAVPVCGFLILVMGLGDLAARVREPASGSADTGNDR